MIFKQVATGGCQSYLMGCSDTCGAALIDPELTQVDHYKALAARDGLRIRFVIDTHTHADHFSATRQLAQKLRVPVVMHRGSLAPFVDMRIGDGEMVVLGKLRLRALHTPGHTSDSMCLHVEDRVFTGDTLLIGGTGRTDLPTGDPGALYDSLFERVLRLDPALLVYPAHDYKNRTHSTIGQEAATNPRLQVQDRAAFIDMMNSLNLSMPTHITEGLRTNMNGGKAVAQLLAEAAARAVHGAARIEGTRRGGPRRPDHPRCARTRCVRGWPRAGRAAVAARPALDFPRTRTPFTGTQGGFP